MPANPSRNTFFTDLRHWRQFALGALAITMVAAGLTHFSVSSAVFLPVLWILTLATLRILYGSISRPIAELRELKKIDQMKSEFVSTVSHELRTPLTSIGGYVKLISAGDAGPVTETQHEFLAIVEANVERLTVLINDILDMERMESGKFHLLKEPQDLRAILQDCYDSLLLMAHQKGLELRFKIPSTAPWIVGEKSRLNQIFVNLVSNAIKYTNSGFVEVEVEPLEGLVHIRIRDSGIGISEGERSQLFQRFYRTDAGLASREKGTGLGLAITRGLIEAHGGTISVDSEAGKGSVFTVTLPTSPVYNVSEIATSPDKSDELLRAIRNVENAKQGSFQDQSKKVWVIDADLEAAQQMGRLLEEQNPFAAGQKFITRSFSSVHEVPELNGDEPTPDVVIVDPAGLAGETQSLSELRQKLRVTVPILVVSDSVDTSAAFAEGALAWTTKPINVREFWIALHDVLQNRGLRILIGDANTDFRILIKRELEQRGFEVDDVDRGKLVMGRLDHDQYDLVLIDVGFPDVSGIELLKAIRKRSQLDLVPVFLMHEGSVEEPQSDELQSSGKDVFIGKERGIEGIVQVVADELELFRE